MYSMVIAKKRKILKLRRELNALKRIRRQQLRQQRQQHLAPPPPVSPRASPQKRKKPPVPLFEEPERKKRKINAPSNEPKQKRKPKPKRPSKAHTDVIDLTQPIARKSEPVDDLEDIFEPPKALRIRIDPPAETKPPDLLEEDLFAALDSPEPVKGHEIIDLSDSPPKEEPVRIRNKPSPHRKRLSINAASFSKESLPDHVQDFSFGSLEKEPDLYARKSRSPQKKLASYKAPEKVEKQKISGTLSSQLLEDFNFQDSVQDKSRPLQEPEQGNDLDDDSDDDLLFADLVGRNEKSQGNESERTSPKTPEVQKDSMSELDEILFSDFGS